MPMNIALLYKKKKKINIQHFASNVSVYLVSFHSSNTDSYLIRCQTFGMCYLAHALSLTQS